MTANGLNPFMILTLSFPVILTWGPYGTPLVLGLATLCQLFISPFSFASWLRKWTGTKILTVSWIGLAAISCFWHYEPLFAWQSLTHVCPIVMCGGLLLSSIPFHETPSFTRAFTPLTALKITLASLVIITLSLILFAGIRDAISGVYSLQTIDRFSPAAALWCLIFWPILELAKMTLPRWNGYWSALLIAVFTGFLCLQAMAAAIVAFSAAVATYVAIQKLPKAIPILVSLKIIALAWVSPIIAYFLMTPSVLGDFFTQLPFSWRHRLYIWHFVSEKIFEKPWLGWGYFSARYFPGGGEDFEVGMAKIPMHPHNIFLQLWLDFGVMGPALFTCLMMILYQKLKGLTQAKPMGFALIVTYIYIELFSFSIWQSWWLAGTLICVIFSKQIASRVEA
jgi:O-antigen ligase